MVTLRQALGENYKTQTIPWNVEQLVRATKVARDSINKMIDGDYSTMRMTTIAKAWLPFGVVIQLNVDYQGVNGNSTATN